MLSANRQQVTFLPTDLESILPEKHGARAVWGFVEGLNLERIYGKIQAVEGEAGRPAIDPKILIALWLYATLQGVGSARALAQLCEMHRAYQWICGGVRVNYHTLADFRVAHAEELGQILTDSAAALMAQGLVKMKRVAQDGVRVRASAGAASFRRKRTLEEYRQQAAEQVSKLRAELEADPGATTRRQAAAKKRAAEDRQKRIEEALKHMPEMEEKRKAGEKDQARVSTTDAEARVMKMADGGFRPAYNGQFATDTDTQVIVGVEVSNSGNDAGQMPTMMDQIQERYGRRPKEILVDGGFGRRKDIEAATEKGSTVYAPVMKPLDSGRDPHAPMAGDSETIAAWRARMGTEQAKRIYKERAATAECVNAISRNRGLQQFRVRGIKKVRAVLLWFALAHNLIRGLQLCLAAPATS